MKKYIQISTLLICALALNACARLDNTRPSSVRDTGLSANEQLASTQPNEQFSSQEILSFLPTQIIPSLSDKEKTEAASAQFFALQYGRVGAFREWHGDSDKRGEISVGPYIKVNKLDCREFSHTVIVDKQRHTKTGTSCREVDGQWRVVG